MSTPKFQSKLLQSNAAQNRVPQSVATQTRSPQTPPHYVVLQVTLKEKFIGTGSKNLSQLEAVINSQCAKGYRLHTMSTASAASTGLMGGDRIQATLVFESL